MAIYKAYRDESYLIGLCSEKVEELPLRHMDFFDGYLDLSPDEREKFLKCEHEFWKWQELLGKRYKKA
jgi:hypothetical protein